MIKFKLELLGLKPFQNLITYHTLGYWVLGLWLGRTTQVGFGAGVWGAVGGWGDGWVHACAVILVDFITAIVYDYHYLKPREPCTWLRRDGHICMFPRWPSSWLPGQRKWCHQSNRVLISNTLNACSNFCAKECSPSWIGIKFKILCCNRNSWILALNNHSRIGNECTNCFADIKFDDPANMYLSSGGTCTTTIPSQNKYMLPKVYDWVQTVANIYL